MLLRDRQWQQHDEQKQSRADEDRAQGVESDEHLEDLVTSKSNAWDTPLAYKEDKIRSLSQLVHKPSVHGLNQESPPFCLAS